MKKIDLQSMNPVVDKLSTQRHSPSGIVPRMVRIFESSESRLARRIKNGKTNSKIGTRNS